MSVSYLVKIVGGQKHFFYVFKTMNYEVKCFPPHMGHWIYMFPQWYDFTKRYTALSFVQLNSF